MARPGKIPPDQETETTQALKSDDAQLARQENLRELIEDALEDATQDEPPTAREARRHILKMNLGYPVLFLVFIWAFVIWVNGLGHFGISFGRSSRHAWRMADRPIFEGLGPFFWLSLALVLYFVLRYLLARWLAYRGVQVTGKVLRYRTIGLVPWGRMSFTYRYAGKDYKKAHWGTRAGMGPHGAIEIVFDPARHFLWQKRLFVFPARPRRKDRHPRSDTQRRQPRVESRTIIRSVRIWRKGPKE